MEENLVNIEADAPVTGTPSEWEQDSITPENVKNQDKEEKPQENLEELTDEQLDEDIKRLKDEVDKEEDPKEKRHKQQDIGWKMKIQKERKEAKEWTEKSKQAKQSLIDEVYEKALDANYWLSYFEKLFNTDSKLADEVAKSKWNKSAKQLILESKRELAEQNGDEELKKQITEEDIRQSEREKIYHELAIQQVEDIFWDLWEEEKVEAKEYFNDIVEWKKLTPETAKKYAKMAKVYVSSNKPQQPKNIDKEKIIIPQSATWIWWTKSKETIATNQWDLSWIRQQLLNAWISKSEVDRMFPLN